MEGGDTSDCSASGTAEPEMPVGNSLDLTRHQILLAWQRHLLHTGNPQHVLISCPVQCLKWLN